MNKISDSGKSIVKEIRKAKINPVKLKSFNACERYFQLVQKNTSTFLFMSGFVDVIVKFRCYNTKDERNNHLNQYITYKQYASTVGIKCTMSKYSFEHKKKHNDDDDYTEDDKQYCIITVMGAIDMGGSVNLALNDKSTIDTVHVNLIKHAINFDIMLEELKLSCVNFKIADFAMMSLHTGNDSSVMVLIDEKNLVDRNDKHFVDEFNKKINAMRKKNKLGVPSADVEETIQNLIKNDKI